MPNLSKKSVSPIQGLRASSHNAYQQESFRSHLVTIAPAVQYSVLSNALPNRKKCHRDCWLNSSFRASSTPAAFWLQAIIFEQPHCQITTQAWTFERTPAAAAIGFRLQADVRALSLNDSFWA